MESERGERRGEEGEEEVRCIDRICDCEVDLTWTLVFNNGIQTRIHKKGVSQILWGLGCFSKVNLVFIFSPFFQAVILKLQDDRVTGKSIQHHGQRHEPDLFPTEHYSGVQG